MFMTVEKGNQLRGPAKSNFATEAFKFVLIAGAVGAIAALINMVIFHRTVGKHIGNGRQ